MPLSRCVRGLDTPVSSPVWLLPSTPDEPFPLVMDRPIDLSPGRGCR